MKSQIRQIRNMELNNAPERRRVIMEVVVWTKKMMGFSIVFGMYIGGDKYQTSKCTCNIQESSNSMFVVDLQIYQLIRSEKEQNQSGSCRVMSVLNSSGSAMLEQRDRRLQVS